jgi:hypothetical protein
MRILSSLMEFSAVRDGFILLQGSCSFCMHVIVIPTPMHFPASSSWWKKDRLFFEELIDRFAGQ